MDKKKKDQSVDLWNNTDSEPGADVFASYRTEDPVEDSEKTNGNRELYTSYRSEETGEGIKKHSKKSAGKAGLISFAAACVFTACLGFGCAYLGSQLLSNLGKESETDNNENQYNDDNPAIDLTDEVVIETPENTGAENAGQETTAAPVTEATGTVTTEAAAQAAAQPETTVATTAAAPTTVAISNVSSDFMICTKDYYRTHTITKADMDELNAKYKDVIFPYYTALPQMMIDEMYAMEGYSFQSPGYANYFQAKDWYSPGECYFQGCEDQNIKFLVYMDETTPFYGIFVGNAYASQDEALYSDVVNSLQQEEMIPSSGAVAVVNMSDWKNLASMGSGYLITTYKYRSEIEANSVLETLKSKYPDARILYTGDYQGSITGPQ